MKQPKRRVWYWRLDYDDRNIPLHRLPAFLISCLPVLIDWTTQYSDYMMGNDEDDGKQRSVPVDKFGILHEGSSPHYSGHGDTREEAIELAKKKAQALAVEVLSLAADRVTIALERGARPITED